MKKLMILGAGVYQVPLIQRAQEMGLETIVVSYPGPYPGLSLADRPLLIDTTDAKSVLNAARSEGIDGITTTGTDVAVRTMGVVCDELSLPGVSESCARALTDKAAMKEMFRRGGVPSSPFEVVRTLGEAGDAARRIGVPVMVKACDVSGSRGVTKVDSERGLGGAYAAATAATHTDHLLVEKFVEGTEIGVDGFVVDGIIELFAPHTKFVRRVGGVTIPAGHAFPSDLAPETLSRLREAMLRAVGASDMRVGAFNADVMVTPDGGVSVLEMGARCGATGIPELIEMHTGIDYYEQIVRASLGMPVDLAVRGDLVPCMSGLLFSDGDGTVDAVDESRVAELGRLHRAAITIDVRPGDAVRAAHDGTDRFGSVVMPTGSESELEAVLGEVRDCVSLR